MAANSSAGIAYRPEIDGIRAIAVLSVFCFHLFPTLLPGGYLGVDVFFVISGYLITAILLRELRLGTFSLARFYARRVKRIFPALFTVLLLSTLAAIVLLPPGPYRTFMQSARYASVQIANFLFAREVGYFGEGFSGQPLLHTWSLAVEEQFYLCWPLFLYLCCRFLAKNNNPAGDQGSGRQASAASPAGWHRIAGGGLPLFAGFFLLALLSFALCFLLAEGDPQNGFYMFYTRAWEFCLGGMVALRPGTQGASPAVGRLAGTGGMLLLAYSFFAVDHEYLGFSFLRFGVVLPCLGTVLLLGAAGRPNPVSSMLAAPLPVAIGRISYSLYLYHWPLIIFAKMGSGSHTLGNGAALLIVVTAFGLAALSYRFIEQPARKGTWPDRAVLVFALLLMLACSQGLNNLEGQGQAAWRVTRTTREEPVPPPPIPAACVRSDSGDLAFFECRVSGRRRAPKIALVGDSHAPHYLHALAAWAGGHGYDLRFLGVPGCPMLLGEVRLDSLMDEGHEAQCAAALPLFASRIVDDPAVEIVLIAQRWDLFHNGKGVLNASRQLLFRDQDGRPIADHTAYFRRRLAETVHRLRAAGKEPVLLKQVPVLGSIGACDWEPLARRWFSRDKACVYDRGFIESWQRPSIRFIDAFAAEHAVLSIDPFPFFDEPLVNGVNLYLNIDHLNVHGNLFMVVPFSRAMDAVFAEIRTRRRSDHAPGAGDG